MAESPAFPRSPQTSYLYTFTPAKKFKEGKGGSAMTHCYHCYHCHQVVHCGTSVAAMPLPLFVVSPGGLEVKGILGIQMGR
eukprot:s219_g11.t1